MQSFALELFTSDGVRVEATSEVVYVLDDGGVIAFGDPEIDLREDPTSLVLRGQTVGSATIRVRVGAFEAELTAHVTP